MEKNKKIIKSFVDDHDPYLIKAGKPVGNEFRTKRACVRLEQQEIANKERIRQLKIENQKMRERLARLKVKAQETERLEEKFAQLSAVIMDSKIMQTTSEITHSAL